MLTEGREPVSSTGQQFVGIGLMAYIPDDFIFRCMSKT